MSKGQLTYVAGGHGNCDRCSECGDIPRNESILHHMETMHPGRPYANAKPHSDERPTRTLAHVVADLAILVRMAHHHATERTALAGLRDLAAEAQRIAEDA